MSEPTPADEPRHRAVLLAVLPEWTPCDCDPDGHFHCEGFGTCGSKLVTRDRHGLLKDNVLLGSRPPMAYRFWESGDVLGAGEWGPWRFGHHPHWNNPEANIEAALVLAFNGNVVPEGLDRAMRVYEGHTESEDRPWEWAYDLWWCRLTDAKNVADACEVAGLGRAEIIEG